MKEARLARSEKAALVPLWHVMVVPGLLIGHALTWLAFDWIITQPLRAWLTRLRHGKADIVERLILADTDTSEL
jgi:hypothetical protein